ncbi:MAG TPA: hypothetical protein VNK41_10705 [Vicinamibacterales bacterium]|nr:hypothetical protein [Vicinamibacterales bacterium]
MVRRARLCPLLLVCFVLLAGTAAADQNLPIETEKPVAVQIVTAADLKRMPSCGRMLTDLVHIAPAPALNVTKTTLNLPTGTDRTSVLERLSIRTSDGVDHPATDPFCIDSIDVLRDGASVIYGGDSVAGTIDFILGRTGPAPFDASLYRDNFYAEPFLNPSQVQIIRGPFDGRAPGTRVEIGGQPGLILAETPEALFWLLPEGLAHGSATLTLTDAGRGAKFPVYVLGLAMSADQLKLLRGQSTAMQATVFGPELIPEEAWKAGDVSATVDLKEVRRLFPDFTIPKPGDPGVLFFRVDNLSRETVSMKPSRNESFVRSLTRSDFASGPYTYRARIQSKKAGGFTINGVVVGFFAPIPGEPWTPAVPRALGDGQ